MMTLGQSKSYFFEKILYVTSAGAKITVLGSQYGTFEKPPGGQELELSGYFATPATKPEEELIRIIQDHYGWPLKIPRPQQILSEPAGHHLKFLSCFDPKCLFLGDAESKRNR